MDMGLGFFWGLCLLGSRSGDYGEAQRCYRVMGVITLIAFLLFGIDDVSVGFALISSPFVLTAAFRDLRDVLVFGQLAGPRT